MAWNDLGMHCMDADYSVFALMPPYNNIRAQVIDATGKLVKAPGGIQVTYEAVADANGSVNTTSIGKTNFWDNVKALFGVLLDPDTGLTGSKMPGAGNTPRALAFDPANNWFTGSAIPITPNDDGGNKNYYPMMRVVARDPAGKLLAGTNIVTPVSDEMNCAACHASGASRGAQPAEGWVNDPNPDRDYKLNILLLHDDLQSGTDAYQQSLAATGYNSAGLYAAAAADGTPVLCAGCHASNALGANGIAGIPPLTTSMHALHAAQRDPLTGMTLDDENNRDACYRCHPGSTTQGLRGVMGSAVNPDGTMMMQCQSCHGSMSALGDASRTGWLSEPGCQSCHTGTATRNMGALRFTSVFDANGQARTPADTTFATNADVPAAGFSLYRFSAGHSGMQCEACHGATHAEYPSAQASDNQQSIAMQGYAGVLSDCSACHRTPPSNLMGGPHGMHVVGQTWVTGHQRLARGAQATCQPCHGADYRGTVLSATQVNRTLSIEGGSRTFVTGTQIGCYSCHNGPNGG